MDEELAIIQEAKDKMALANRKKDVAILKQVLEPIEEGMDELSESINILIKFFKNGTNNPEYFDKELGKNVILAFDKILGLLKTFKQPEFKLDLSPIATEIKKQNENIIALLNKPNQSEELQKLITALVGKQSAFLEREFKETNYSKELSEINKSIENNKPKEWEFTIIRVDDSSQRIKKVIAKSK